MKWFWLLPATGNLESKSRSVVSDSLWPHELYSPWNSPGQNTQVDSFSLLEGIFPTQGLNWGLPHCRRILYQLSHKGSPQETLNGNKRKCWLFKFLRSYFSWRSRDLQHWVVWKNDCIPVSAPPLSVNISDQNTDPIYLKDRVHIVQTGSHRLCESCSREMHSCLPQGCR